MQIEKGKIYAVITGDIVESSELSAGARMALFDTMRKIGDELARWLGPEVMPLPLDIFSGDSWQLLLADPSRALDAAVFYRAGLSAAMGAKKSKHKGDTRLSIAIGEIDFVPGHRVSEGEGWAFRESGRPLADKSAAHRMLLRMQYPPHWNLWPTPYPTEAMRLRAVKQYLSHQDGWQMAVILLDVILQRRLTPARATSIKGALQGLGQREIGELTNPPISQPSVARNLKSIEWETISECLQEFANQWNKDATGRERIHTNT